MFLSVELDEVKNWVFGIDDALIVAAGQDQNVVVCDASLSLLVVDFGDKREAIL